MVPPRSRLGPASLPDPIFTVLGGPASVPPPVPPRSRPIFYSIWWSRLGPAFVLNPFFAVLGGPASGPASVPPHFFAVHVCLRQNTANGLVLLTILLIIWLAQMFFLACVFALALFLWTAWPTNEPNSNINLQPAPA